MRAPSFARAGAAAWIGYEFVYLAGVLLLAWNFLLFVEYRFDLIQAGRPPTWEEVTIRRVTYFIERLFG